MYFKAPTPAQTTAELAVSDKIVALNEKHDNLSNQLTDYLKSGQYNMDEFNQICADLNANMEERNILSRELDELLNQRVVRESIPTGLVMDDHWDY